MIDFCREHAVPVDICGKLVVASDEGEVQVLDGLLDRGLANGLTGLRLVDQQEMQQVEPAVRGIRALWVPEAGIVDYSQVATALMTGLRAAGVSFRFESPVVGLTIGSHSVEVRTARGTISAEYVIACAGLHSDRIAVMTGAASAPKIVPFRGDYYVLRPDRRSLIRSLVYPVPDSRFPFLGVHFTRRINGDVWMGPNAVLAFAREGYRRTDVDFGDLLESISYVGFRRLAARYWRTALDEMARDFVKALFVKSLRRYVPELTAADLLPGPSGVRAQAVDTAGGLIDDFAYDTTERVLNVRNAPSPAATSSLALASVFVDQLERQFETRDVLN